MCDYSLHLTAPRPARVGEELITTVFANSTTRGLAAPGEANVAVCLLPGTEVAFEIDVEYTQPHLLPQVRISERVARFREVDRDRPDVHHDAFEFPSGLILLIHHLCPGQRLTVVQLPVSQRVGLEHAHALID